jgi:outer membrane protein assembly factor BamB
MDRLRILCLLVVCVFAGCRDRLATATEGELLIQPARVDFGQRWWGHRGTRVLELQNTARGGLEVTLEVGAPFDAPLSVELGGGERLEVELGVTAAQLGLVEGTLRVSANGVTQQVPLRANVVQPPTCELHDCRVVTFNPETGRCDETVEADGALCGATNQCITAGVCMAGECVGQARDCDDGNACTSDACEASTGCVHETVKCPLSLRACEVPVCSPTTGCGLAPAVDGASCGANDCVTAQVCITGQCVPRPAPDGSQCKEATSCRAPGVCRQQVCELPAPTELQPAWRYAPDPGKVLVYFGHVDDSGNLYATETGPFLRNGDRAGAAIQESDPPSTPTYLVSLTPAGAVRFKVEVTTDCSACTQGLWFSIDSAGRRLFFNAKGTTQARSTDDGRLLWSVVPSNGLPAYDLRADGGAAYSTSAPMLIGTAGVGVPVMEGNSDHHAYVQVFDRTTGAFLWQFHRKGHLYGAGTAVGGELWTSSANCWAVAGEMARMSAAGQAQASKFVQWIPAIYGEGVAIGTANGRLHSLNPALELTDLTTITGASAASSPLISGQQLVLWDTSSHTLKSVNLTSGVHAFAYRGVTGASPEFELLRDGGVGWTSQLTDGGLLGAVNGRGEELLNCPLPSPVESATAISKGRAFMFSRGEIVAYDVPGLDVEPSGWVSRQGSLQRGYGAR